MNFDRISEITVFLYWLAYLATTHIDSQFPRACLPHSLREINQITGGSHPLRWLNFKNCESEPYIYDIILRIPLYCKLFLNDRSTWLKIAIVSPPALKFKYQVKLLCIVFFPQYYNSLILTTL